MKQIQEILKRLKSLYDRQAVEGMARFGITPEKSYGISIPILRNIAREIGRDHKLAQKLWELNIRETRILACMIDDPDMVSEKQMEKWVRDFDYWEICDQCCQNLFEKTKFAYQKSIEWSLRDEEFVRRAGFVLMALISLRDREAENERFEEYLNIIKKKSIDNRNYVKKAVSWALRQIGKRNLYLNARAIETAREIKKLGAKSGKWIAQDAIRELTSKAVRQRLRKGDR